MLPDMWNLKFPNQGSNPHSLPWKHGVITTGLPRKSREFVILDLIDLGSNVGFAIFQLDKPGPVQNFSSSVLSL